MGNLRFDPGITPPTKKCWSKLIRRMKKRAQKRKSAVPDSCATASFWRPEDEHEPVDKPSDHILFMANGNASHNTTKTKPCNKSLNDKVKYLDLIPILKDNALSSVCKIPDAGYTTI